MTATDSTAAPRRSERFFLNVVWSWTGVAINLFTGFYLSPYIIRKLGDEGYGVWALVFSLVEYYYLLDMGFRSATVKFSAHFRATNELDEVNKIVNTGLAYFSGGAVLVLSVSLVCARYAGGWFKISAAYQEIFSYLLVLVGVSWSMGTLFVVFDGLLEGFQRFDISSRIWIGVTAMRAIGSFLLLWSGHGIIALGLMAVASQVFGYVLSFLGVRRVFPQLRFGFSYVNVKTLKSMWGYGVHTAVSSLSERMLNQNPNLLIGHFRPSAEIGYFSMPLRLLQYVAEAVYRVGSVTASNIAELCARGETEAVARFGIYANRYCVTLFLPLGIFLWVFGPDFVKVWINPEFARRSAVVLPVLTAAYEFAIAAQFNSGSILFGLGKHRGYSRSYLVEAVLSAVGLYLLIPHFGIAGAAWVTAGLMIANRGLFAPWLVCHHLHFSYARYMTSIYIRPLLASLPALGVALFLKSRIVDISRFQLLYAAAALSVVFYAAAYLICLEPDHRTTLLATVRTRLKLGSS